MPRRRGLLAGLLQTAVLGSGRGTATTEHIHDIYRDPTNDYGAKDTQ
jgi:hypothetical protein